MEMRFKIHWPHLLAIVVLLLLLALYFLSPELKKLIRKLYAILTELDKDAFVDLVKSYGIWGPLIILLATCLQLILLPLPSFLILLIAVLVYGPFWGTLLGLTAIFLASSLGFFLGKSLSDIWLKRLIGERKKQKLESALDQYGYWVVFIFRLNPFLSNDAISLIGGVLSLNYWKFIGASLAGILPLLLMIAWYEEEAESMQEVLLWPSLAMLLFLIIYMFFRLKNAKYED